MMLRRPNILIRGGVMSINLKKFEKVLRKELTEDINCREWHSSIILEGFVRDWATVIKAGQMAVKLRYKGVVNKLEVRELILPKMKKPTLIDNNLNNKQTDVLIIGGGIIGSSIARELSKWNISILLIDKECDLAMHASSRNDGMVHPGFEPKPGSKKAYFNVKGNKMYTRISKELNVPFSRNGSTILFDKAIARLAYPIVKARVNKNGVEGMRYLSKGEIRQLEPNVLDNITGALHFNSTGVLSPYKMAVAYAENAVQNGAEISFNTVALSIEKQNGKINSVRTNRGTIYPKVVINAAGVFADEIAAMADDQFFSIHPRKGEIIFLDKKTGKLINGVIAMPPLTITKGNTKGGGLVKTIDGNILVGPDAYEQPYKEDYSTNKENLDKILKKQLPIIPKLKISDVITYCAGTRAATYEEDFIIEKSEYIDNLVYAAGIQSPGLASAPAIAEEIENITINVLKGNMNIAKKDAWNPNRESIPDLSYMSFEERSRLIKKRPDYGIIICRCEEISKGEIIDALSSPIPVDTVDGVKRRVRAGMGRCQGGFCLPLVMEVIAETRDQNMCTVTKKGNESKLLVEPTKKEESKSGGVEGGGTA